MSAEDARQNHPPQREFHRDEVQAGDRYAWAGPEDAGVTEYYFDRCEFWRNAGGRDVRVPIEDVPALGWWHKRGCRCASCRSRQAPDERAA